MPIIKPSGRANGMAENSSKEPHELVGDHDCSNATGYFTD